VSETSPLRWMNRIVLGVVAIFVLVQVVIRILRRTVPGPMPSVWPRCSLRPCARDSLTRRSGYWIAQGSRLVCAF
jgi:hypothetical protein